MWLRAALVAALLMPAVARTADEWTPSDTARQVVVSAFLVADWAQTRDIAHRPEDCHETNPILGKHPSDAQVDAYFAAGLAGHAAVSYLLPRGWREGWQYVWIGAEAKTVHRNHYTIGLHFAF